MNKDLNKAKTGKNDEFYTSYEDIEKEIDIYYNNDNNIFKDKVILLPCNDYDSNFYKYFFDNDEKFQYKKLIAVNYKQNSESEYKIYSGNCLVLENLNSNGDFRSEEVTKLRDEVDFIFTNPPFSLFREFVDWLKPFKGKYSIIGNMNAITYKNVFPLIKVNKMWLGLSIGSGDREFGVPDDYPLNAAISRIDEYEYKYIRVKGVRWFTNINMMHLKPLLQMNSVDFNINNSNKLSPTVGYIKYDNYNAIEVPSVKLIPNDYEGVMGVPITFIDKYNPKQFELVGSDYEVKDGLLDYLINKEWTGKLDRAYIDGERKYGRLFIKHKNQ